MSVSAARYTKIAMLLHWLIAIMIIGLIAAGWAMTHLDIPNKFAVYQLHKSFGIMVFLLSFLRLGWRLTHKPPPLPTDMKAWERRAAKFTHIGFYVLMIGMPLLGWAMVSASPYNIPTKLFSTIPWPHLPILPELENKKAVESAFKLAHEMGAKLMILLILLHIGAALKHHVINKDNVLARMVPFLRRRAG